EGICNRRRASGTYRRAFPFQAREARTFPSAPSEPLSRSLRPASFAAKAPNRKARKGLAESAKNYGSSPPQPRYSGRLRRSETHCHYRCTSKRGGYKVSRFNMSDLQGTRSQMLVLSSRSHPVVVRTTAALGWNPCDDLVGIVNVAGLAVHAVRRVQADALAIGRAAVIHHLVHIRGTEMLA